ncbi:TPA: aspartate--tRNA ligase [Candidatus Woesearchaeota archaeon]|nr:aspartate--tRNA ligase [Candidatus Woesearchaeota archaeon]
MHRTHNCGELRAKDEGTTVTIAGWTHAIRLHGRIAFIDVRDRYGITQATVGEDFADLTKDLKRESVIKITGVVKKKPQPNPRLATGEIEVVAEKFEVLNPAQPLPIEIEAENSDEIRLKYRYLDLRRPAMQHKLAMRDNVAASVRKHLRAMGFLEIETPLLVKSTPEGARDYVVPSRIHHGTFYALPQSPQLYKQLLMVSGCDRYFQLAKCLRDEDLRMDRQPEFTQIDVEMSFVEQDDVLSAGERLVHNVVKDVKSVDVPLPLRRISYEESMDRYGCDKPDLRFGLELTDVTYIVKSSDFKIFSEAQLVKCLVVPKLLGRKEIDRYTEFAKANKAKGLAYVNVLADGKTLDGGVAKFLTPDMQASIIEASGAKPEQTILFVADAKKACNEALSKLRNLLGKELSLYDPKALAFCWVVDFPLFEWDDDTQDWTPAHHMFTMPRPEHLQYLRTEPGKVVAQCYDLVLNGVEMASGSIRVHRQDIQREIMTAMNISEEQAKVKFGFLLEAFTYGAPPHGGFAIGFDRFVAMLEQEADIREFIAFPKNKSAECPMDGSPSLVDAKQLDDLGLALKKL